MDITQVHAPKDIPQQKHPHIHIPTAAARQLRRVVPPRRAPLSPILNPVKVRFLEENPSWCYFINPPPPQNNGYGPAESGNK